MRLTSGGLTDGSDDVFQATGVKLVVRSQPRP